MGTRGENTLYILAISKRKVAYYLKSFNNKQIVGFIENQAELYVENYGAFN